MSLARLKETQLHTWPKERVVDEIVFMDLWCLYISWKGEDKNQMKYKTRVHNAYESLGFDTSSIGPHMEGIFFF